MAETLVIVESPAKAKTIGKYLGRDYTVYASKGHVRDLPEKGLGVDVDNGTFQPDYQIKRGQWPTITKIKEAARNATTVLLATDPDREGEAIAWHILIAAGLGKGRQNVRRVEFHEITAAAIQKAIANPRQVDMNLVNAQQARRVLDRLVGYKISPLLWKKVQRGLSAGRVQSVALRVIVEREEEIEEFVPREFWTVEADLAKHPFKGNKSEIFHAVLWDKKPNENKKTGGKKVEFEHGDAAKAVVEALTGANWTVASVIKEEAKRYPSAPFTTSTLQQEASRKLHYLAKRTMQVAQQLYEGVSVGPEGNVGLITYMRTDSTQVAHEAQLAAGEVIKKIYGAEYLPPKPPFYATKTANAQEAHEAIRPTSAAREPDQIKGYLTDEQYWLYRLIWQRFIASQMTPAILENTIADINAQPQNQARPAYLFRANGLRVVFSGFLIVYKALQNDENSDNKTAGIEKALPPLTSGDLLDALKVGPEQHFTQPPPRYSEATLVKTLEELGVGRPSTYATILTTIQERGYVIKAADKSASQAGTENAPTASSTAKRTNVGGSGRAEQRFHPTALGRAVNSLLVERFPNIVDVKFTARMEQELDEVASGERAWTPLIANFYGPMMTQLAIAEREVVKIEVPVEDSIPMAAKASGGRSYSYKGRGSKSAGAAATTKTTNYYRRKSTTLPAAIGEEKSGWNSSEAVTVKPARRTRKTTAKKLESTATGPAPRTGDRSSVKTSTEPTAVSTAAATTTMSCDKCGKSMVQRKGPYGEFWGCTGYPNCRNTRK